MEQDRASAVLFAFITLNWRGKPLVSHQVIVQLIGATTTETGLNSHPISSRRDALITPQALTGSTSTPPAITFWDADSGAQRRRIQATPKTTAAPGRGPRSRSVPPTVLSCPFYVVTPQLPQNLSS